MRGKLKERAQIGSLCLLISLGLSTGCSENGGVPQEPDDENKPVESSTDPGLLTLRRLNKIEFDNTVRDLLGTSLRPGENFPPENLDEGFDVIGEALTIQPLHLELMEKAAADLASELIARPADDPYRQRILSCDAWSDAVCVQTILTDLANRAWRRPVETTEIESLAALIQHGSTPDEGLSLALQGVFLSPHFLYRVEIDPNPLASAPHALNPYELASRLSYLLWSSMPDDALFDAAKAGELQTDEQILAQLDRMLADAKSQGFVSHFAGQWLNLRRVEQVNPDYETFPEFDLDLRTAMRIESESFFRAILDTDVPIAELLTAPYTFVNARLAEHYGLSGQFSEEFVRVSTEGSTRAGLLTQGSFLALTSNPTRTSPVKRGKWVLDQLLCEGPPPPPPGVETDLEAVGEGELTTRERLELHRVQPSCAGCHVMMDPIGLSFENFDAVGAYRTEEGGAAIDASGLLPVGGETVAFQGPQELAQIISEDPRLVTCAVKKLVTYGVGRKVGKAERPMIESIVTGANERGNSLRDILSAVVTSHAFKTRRAE
jgi:Protein of unknown function (DUF1592)/Protein of unknown function (DUF1588)/Protein of unknown function (DUF1595)/Protein of unknown function (DUF1587)/Protein of unknown function (DUF1585)